VVTNSIGWDVQFFLPGAFVDNPFPRAVNGSLWTIPIELRMYVCCAVAGVLTLLARRALFNAVLIAGIALVALRPEWFQLDSAGPGAAQLVLAFALGAFAWVNREWIPLSPWAAAIALLLIAINPDDVIRGPFFVPLIAYALLTFSLHPITRFASFNRIGDYSYGLYLYAYPIQQALAYLSPGVSPLVLFIEAFILTLILAIVSWHRIEKPALGLKSGFGRPVLQPK
jgi:peptidoglycan/LPS O-acetylase OafA/YrhL